MACGHIFHQTCLRDLQSCHICDKTNYMIIREEYERVSEKAYKGEEESKEDSDEYEQREQGWAEQGKQDEAEFKSKVVTRVLERFDTILDDINLELS
mmetsp:Transcript_24221/g.30015  ORF Transcript_24221/g.30015 Transcript_24221/m.30015 type:complete len:97 (+) Transcript_24221:574-864(+)